MDARDSADLLPPRAQALLGLLLLTVFEPLLGQDGSARGTANAEAVRRLHERAWQTAIADDRKAAAEVEATLEAMPDLQADEEPPGPGFYRVSFIAALLYSVNAQSGTVARYAASNVLACLDDLSYFLEEEQPGVLEGVELPSLRARATAAFRQDGPDAAVATLGDEFAAAADRLRQNLAAARRAALEPAALDARVAELEPKVRALLCETLAAVFEPAGGVDRSAPEGCLPRLRERARRLVEEVPGALEGVDFDGLLLHALVWFEAFDEDWVVEDLGPEVAAAADRLRQNLERSGAA